MTLSTIELAKARDAANTILEQLHLDAYIFEVEPRDDDWELTIECATEIDGAWETIKLQVPKGILLAGVDDESVRYQLVEYCKKKLAGCKLQKN